MQVLMALWHELLTTKSSPSWSTLFDLQVFVCFLISVCFFFCISTSFLNSTFIYYVVFLITSRYLCSLGTHSFTFFQKIFIIISLKSLGFHLTNSHGSLTVGMRTSEVMSPWTSTFLHFVLGLLHLGLLVVGIFKI